MASGDLCAYPIQYIMPTGWLYVAFTSGSVEPTPGDVIWGDTSNATGILELIVVTSGTWGGGDAAGWMFMSNWNNTAWSAGENFTKNTTTPANEGTLTGTPALCSCVPTRVGEVPAYQFDADSNQVLLVFGKRLNNDASGGITARIESTGGAATGDVSIGGAFRSYTDDADNLLATSFNSWSTPNYNTAIDAPTVVGETTYDTIAFTDGAQVDSLAASELFMFMLFRDARDATNDDMAAAWNVVNIEFVLT